MQNAEKKMVQDLDQETGTVVAILYPEGNICTNCENPIDYFHGEHWTVGERPLCYECWDCMQVGPPFDPPMR